jgi:hypothetical protein
MRKLTIDNLYGANVICIEGSYSGLLGTVSNLFHGEEKESENEGDYDIVVDFEEVEDMDRLYEELNGTGVDQLFMEIEELALVDRNGITAVDATGNVHIISTLIRK